MCIVLRISNCENECGGKNIYLITISLRFKDISLRWSTISYHEHCSLDFDCKFLVRLKHISFMQIYLNISHTNHYITLCCSYQFGIILINNYLIREVAVLLALHWWKGDVRGRVMYVQALPPTSSNILQTVTVNHRCHFRSIMYI